MLDKKNPVPLYYQLKEEIKKKILSGELKPGDSLPSEHDYMNRYNISRSTVRQALASLKNEGCIRMVRGKGTFVNKPIENLFLGNLLGFSQQMKKQGLPFSGKVLKKEIIKGSSEVSERLEIKPNENVFYLKRLRFVKNKPVIIAENFLPMYLYPGIDELEFENKSLYEILDKDYEIIPYRAIRNFKPQNPSKDDIKLLKISPDTPFLFIESVAFDRKNTPIEFLKAKILGEFSIELISEKGGDWAHKFETKK